MRKLILLVYKKLKRLNSAILGCLQLLVTNPLPGFLLRLRACLDNLILKWIEVVCGVLECNMN
jgi:hypothetical protein